MNRYVVAAAPVLLSLSMGACALTAPRPPEALPSDVPFSGFRTSDGITIAADLILPEGGPAPLVLLGHQVHRDRTSWDPLVPHLLDAGFAVLRIDHRGFGGSTREVPSPQELTGPQKSNLPLDLIEAIDAVAGRTDIDATRIAVVGSEMSVSGAVRSAMERDAVAALVLLSGHIPEEEEDFLLAHPEMPVLLIAASGHPRSAGVVAQHAKRLTGPAQTYVEFDPVDENDDARWIGTDGLREETGMADLIVWFLLRNFAPDLAAEGE